ncbi:MAG TPA: HAD-IIB family hydrolase [bacterium]
MKALIADIDDTICPSIQPIPAETAKEIDRLVRGGRLFCFISGSSMDQISNQITPYLTEPHHLMSASGTHYVQVRYEKGKPVRDEKYRNEFTPSERQEVLGAFEALIKKFDVKSLTTKEDQLQDRGSQITLSSIGRHAPDDKKRTYDPDGSKRSQWVAFLKTLLGDRYSIRIGGTTSVDITQKGVDKAWGIRRFLEINGLQPHEALFLGDKLDPEGNDYPALQVVDCVQVKNPQHTLELLKCILTSPAI